MANKLFQEMNNEPSYIPYDPNTGELGIQEEDPNKFKGNVHSEQIVEHLNWLANSVEEVFSRQSSLDKLAASTEALMCRKDVSPESYKLISIARNHLMKERCKDRVAMALEGHTENPALLDRYIAIEGMYDNLVQFDAKVREKYTILSSKIKEFYENNIKRTGRVKNKVEKLLESVKSKDTTPGAPRVDMLRTDLEYIVYPNTAGSLHQVASVIKSGHFSDKVGDDLKKRLEKLSTFTLKDEKGLEDMAKHLPEHSADTIINGIEGDGFNVEAEKKNDDGSGHITLRSKHGILGKTHIYVIVEYNENGVVNGINITYSAKSIAKKREDGIEEMKTLTHGEQIQVLEAILEVNSAVDKYNLEKSKENKLNKKIEQQLSRLLKESKVNKAKLMKINPEAYKRADNYLHSLFNCLWLLEAPMAMIAANALDICDVNLKYVSQSNKASNSIKL
jgi:hypothetical protein